ncbi:MAG: hypothetical protein ACM3Q4_13125 [Acidobacteriota bacterium]
MLLLIVQICRSETAYLSPGVGISWDLRGHVVWSPKLSIGVLNSHNTFYNLTIGRSTSSEPAIYPHIFIETQAGHLTEPSDFRKIQLFFGGGVGVTIPTGTSSSGVSLRGSLFGGYGLFINANFLFEENINSELGLKIVAPLPLGGIPALGPGKI